MKKTIKEKIARRWLKRNAWKIAKMKVGVGASEKSCFHKQMLLCQKSIGIANA